jgi:hypothetical protein
LLERLDFASKFGDGVELAAKFLRKRRRGISEREKGGREEKRTSSNSPFRCLNRSR